MVDLGTLSRQYQAMAQKLKSWIWEFIVFGIKNARACVFAGSFFIILFLSSHIPLFGLARYDFIFLSAVGLQIIFLLTKVETWDEVRTIFLFHVIGTVLELFKTHPSVGSWSYPEEGLFMIATVPLYSGFMYAAVGSFLAQAWRLLKIELTEYPPYLWTVVLGVAIYANFFANHFVPDIRILLIPAVFLIFARARVHFYPLAMRRSVPLALGFCVAAFFIWIAENISTYLGAWQYPDQVHVWHAVSTGKVTSWFLMVIISFIIVAYLKHYKRDVLKTTSE